MKKLILSVFAVLVLAVVPVVTQAQSVEYGGVGGRPANPREDNPRSESIFIYELEPGDSFEDGVQIFNNTDEDTTVRVGAVDGALSSTGSFACAQNDASQIGVGSWIELETESIVVPAQGNRTVDFTITVPETANVGEQGGCITIQDEAAQNTSQSGGVVLSFRSAIRVAVTIPGEIIKELSFAGIALGPSETNSAQLTATPQIANNGNVSLDTEITTRLVSLFGIPAAEIKGTYPVLPASTASWNFTFDTPFWGGLYRADVIASYNSNVEDSLGEQSGGQLEEVTSSSEYVFITPSPLALFAYLAVLALIIVALGLTVRNLLHRKTVSKKWHTYTIKEGDSIQKIAKARHVSWKKLARANKLKAPYHLEPGHKIKIPPAKE